MATKAELKALMAAADIYDVLGVHYEATTEQIRAARAVLAWKFHPDHWADPRANDAMIHINVAAATILDEGKHKKYRLIKYGGWSVCAPCKGTGNTWKQVKLNVREEKVCSKCHGSGKTK